MKLLHRRKLAAAACLVALLLAGCGDGGSRPTPTPDAAGYPAPGVASPEPAGGYPASDETAAPPGGYPGATP